MARPKKQQPAQNLEAFPPLGKTKDLPGVEGPGVSPLKIDAIEKCITKYERKKAERAKVSPDELEARDELRDALLVCREKLPRNADGLAFYRCDGVDYILEESLRRRKVDTGEEGSD